MENDLPNLANAFDLVVERPRNRCITVLKCLYVVKETMVIALSTVIGFANFCLSLFCLLFLFPINIYNTVRGFDLELLYSIVMVQNQTVNLVYGFYLITLTNK